MIAPESIACSLLLTLALVLAGVAHVAWMGSRWSRPLSIPLDGGFHLRGRPVFGAHKTLRGFVVLPPAAAASMALVHAAWPSIAPGLPRPWELGAQAYAGLGWIAGLGFMLGELPNSFLKRRLDIEPGRAARGRGAAVLFAVLDRTDSILGMLVALALLIPIPAWTWVHLFVLGPLIHLGFSALLYVLGVKARLA